MLIKDFITEDFPVLKKTDTVKYALSVMADRKVRHLPMVDNGIYICLLSDRDLKASAGLLATVDELPLFAPCIGSDGRLHEMLALMARYRLSALPVVSGERRYRGVITCETMLRAMAALCSAEDAGSVIVLELAPRDYAISDIARIIEANNAHILNLLMETNRNSGRLLLTIKIDLADATPVVRSFERFNYTVAHCFMDRATADETLLSRMDELLHYMNM
jgi:CBS domain-containing protein